MTEADQVTKRIVEVQAVRDLPAYKAFTICRLTKVPSVSGITTPKCNDGIDWDQKMATWKTQLEKWVETEIPCLIKVEPSDKTRALEATFASVKAGQPAATVFDFTTEAGRTEIIKDVKRKNAYKVFELCRRCEVSGSDISTPQSFAKDAAEWVKQFNAWKIRLQQWVEKEAACLAREDSEYGKRNTFAASQAK